MGLLGLQFQSPIRVGDRFIVRRLIPIILQTNRLLLNVSIRPWRYSLFSHRSISLAGEINKLSQLASGWGKPGRQRMKEKVTESQKHLTHLLFALEFLISCQTGMWSQ